MTTSAERTQTSEQLRAELMRRLTAGRTGGARRQEIPTVDRALPLPLSAGQQQMWFLNRLEPESPEYLVPLAIRLTGDLDEDTLRTAVDRVVARHEVLRTRYDMIDGEPVQLVDEPGPVPFRTEDLSALPAAARETAAGERVAAATREAFDLAAEWPLRVHLVRLTATEHVLVLVFHHIACDAWSTQIFAQDLSAYYRGSRPAAELSVQYADFAAWQRKNTEGPALDQHLAYWRDRLDDTAPLDLPADRPRPAVRSSAGAAVTLDLPHRLAADLRELATEHRTTLFTVLLTAYQTLLAKYTGTSDIAVGTVVSGRTRPELQQLIGYGINSLVLRGSWDGDPRFDRLLQQARVDVLDAFDHQDMPFARLVDSLQPERDLSRTPLFQAAFTLHESRTAAYDLPGITVRPFETAVATARFDLQLLVEEAPDGSLRGRFEYATALFDEATALRIADHFGRLLHSVAAAPASRLSALDVLAPAERALVLEPAPDETPDPRFVHEAFEAQVAATPDAIAVAADGHELTYAELNARANRIAHHLRTLGAGPDTLVGVCLERGPELMPALLGVLKSGAGYLPLDPANPADRLAYVLQDAGATAVLTETRHAPMIEEIHEGPLVVLDTETATAEWQGLPVANPPLAGHPDQLIYVIYTSGSTGKPKGVCLSHRNVLRLLTTAYRHYAFSTEDVWPLFHSYAFDVSVWEMWGALLHGGKLVVVPAAVTRSPEEFLDLLVDEQVTVLNQTPSAFRSLVAAAAEGDPRIDRLALRAVVFAGEKLIVPDLAPWIARRGLDAPALLNMYGITETTVHTTFYKVTAADLAPEAGNPIGVPLDDLRVHLLDAWGEPAPIGVFGEIHVAGPGVARGYLGRPALTAERFVPDPWGPPGSRLYKSGDIARRLADGSLEFLGRADGQIKIRGYRVELGEIQTALAALPGIHDAVVTLREDTPGAKEIVAYLVTAGGAAHDPAALREALARDLPPYMVPAAFVTLERLPLTTNGKLDKRALPAPGSDARRATGARTAPRTPAEQRIADVWVDVLGLDGLGVDDSFFELGGDSIRAVALVGALRAAGFDVTVRDVFDRRTVAHLAELVTGRSAPAELPSPVAPFELIRPADLERLPAGLTDAYPLSQVQTGMVLEMSLPGGANNYHNVTSFRIRDEQPFDRAALTEAARIVTARHEVLRTSIDLDGYSVPMQLVHADAQMAVGSRSLRGLDEEEVREAILAYTARERADVFDLSVPALMRLYAHDTGTGGWWLSVTECHPVLEGWSHHSLLMEILDLYAALRDGRHVREPAPTAIRFADFIAEEARALQDESHHAYWSRITDGYAPVAAPAGWGEAPGSPRAIHVIEVPVEDLYDRLRVLASRSRASFKSVMLAAHLKVMSQLTEQTRFTAGLVCDSRPELLDADRVYGMYLNTLPFAHDAGRAATWTELVAQVFAAEVELWPHRSFPLPAVQRLAGGRQLIDVYFNYQDFHQVDLDRVDYLASIDDSPTEFPLTVSSRAGHIIVTANGRALSRGNAERVAAMYRKVLVAMAADPEGDARAVLLPADERARVLEEWNESATASAAGTVPELFAARVAADPDAVAVSSGGASLSYGELDARSEVLAHRLLAMGVGPGDVVGVLLERGVELLVALLAVQKSGGAYLPMDASHPAARLAGIVADAAPVALIAQPSLAATADEIHPGGWLPVDGAPASEGHTLPAVDPAAVAYVLYTSGSTGKPKGVQVTHGALGNLLVGMRRVLGEARVDESWLASTSVSFDISGLELYLPLIGGHRVVVARSGEDLTELVAAEEVTHVQATPSGWKLLREAGFTDRSVTALVGGEALPVELARELRSRVGRLVNVYGPTETTIWSSAWEVPEGAEGVSIGAPIDNTQLYVVDALMQPVPLGVVGELCIAGDGVAQGYLGRPDLTAERFVPDPFGPAGSRLYRTGDLARRLFDGSLEFLGRTDHQVKIRGYRIELGEIESRLLAHPQVRDAAVIARTEESGDTWLVGYVIPVSAGELDQAAVRGFLREELPDYMVPGAFVELEAWPLNTAGKLDRKALPAPVESAAAAEYVAPRTEIEARLAEAWATALGHERVSVEDSFFDLGGDSIRAIVLVGAIRSAGFQVAVQDVFEHRTIAALARQVGGPAADGAPVAEEYVQPYALLSDADRAALPAGVTDAYPVSQVQLGMLVEMDLHDEKAAYHNVDAFRVRDGRPFDAAALRRAAEELVLRHEVLRTGFDLTGYGAPLQLVHADVPVEVPVTDLSALSSEAFGPALRAVNAEESGRPFDTARPPLLRVRAVIEDDASWWLVLTHAHAILEGWSYHSLMSELLVCYREFADHGVAGPTDRPASRYADFIAAELASLADPADQEYWRDAVAEHAVLELPAAWGDPQGAEGEAAPYDTVQVNIPTYDLMPRLREVATASGVSLKSVFLAAHLKVLSQITEEPSFHTGLAVDARPEAAGADRVAGMHLNTVPFAHLRTAGTWRELIRQVFDRELALWAHRRHPLPAIQRAAGGRRLVNTVFNYLDFHQVDADLVDEEASTGIGSTEFPLAVISRGGWLGLRSDTRHLTPGQAEGLGEMYRQVLEAIAADPEGDARAAFLPQADRTLALAAPARSLGPVTTTLHSLFEAQVDERPGAGAVTAAGSTLSYGELNARANRIAHRLRALGIGAEDVVGLCLDRGPQLVPALLGILKAGAAYLPMDPSQPAARLAFMAEDQGLKVVLTESAHAPAAAAAHSGVLLVLDGEESAAIAAAPDTDPVPAAESGNLAYVIYTSGSTGVPKGVGVTHANAVRLLLATEERFPLDERHVWPLIHSYAFDVSVFELWAALLYGSRLVVVDADTARNPDELLDLLVAEKLTVLLNSPSAFRGIAAAVDRGDPRVDELHLRAMFFGGEKHDGAALKPWTRRFGLEAPQLVELYGPTEATVQVTHHRVTEADLGSEHGIPLGRPLADTRILVLDEDGRPVPVGVPGELFIGGPALSRGYLGRPALTAERFVPDPYGEPGERLYRTGDLGRLRPDGGLEFLGRTDNQIKIRGYRVELGEIQSVLAAHPAVRQAAVVTDESAPGDPRIAAYAVPSDPEAGLPTAVELAAYCGDRLPEYMVPGAFTALAAIPLISNTKIDRKALPTPDWTALSAGAPYVAPRGEDEERIAAVWAEVLGLERVGAEDAFFDVGGDSIRAVSMAGALRAAGYTLSVRDVFDARTVAGLAALAASGTGHDTAGHRAVEPFALVPAADLPALPAGLTDAYPVSQGQLGILVEMLAEPAGQKYLNVNAFRIRDDRPFDPAALGQAVALLAARHEVLRTGFDLTGHSVPLQLVHAEATLPVAVQDLSGLDAEGVDRAVGRYLAEQRSTPFDLAVPSLLRVSALVEDASQDAAQASAQTTAQTTAQATAQTTAQTTAQATAPGAAWWLGLAECHAITEGWSHHSMLMELLDLYRTLRDGRQPADWSAPEVRYADFVAGELESLASEEDEAYWQQVTARYEPFTLPEGWGDSGSAPEPLLIRVPFADVEPDLRELARSSRASMKSVLHAVHLAVLARLTDQREFSAGLATDARPEALGAERVLGMHLNTVPFAHDSTARTWRELVAQVYAREAETWPHRRYPLPAIQRLADGRRLVEVAFNYQDYKQLDTDLIDIGSSAGAAETEFALIVTTLNGHLSLATHTGVLRREEAERIASMYRAVVLAMATDPGGRALAPLPDGELELLADWGAKDVRDRADTVTGLFAARVAEAPEAVAVSAGGLTLGYRELDERSGRLAARLHAAGVGRGSVVAVGLDRSAELPIALLGILKAGAAYLPLDPAYPADRLAFLLADSGAVALVTAARLADSLPAWDGPVLLVDAAAPDEDGPVAPAAAQSADELAYVMYTSGSTGTPKATEVTRRGVVRTSRDDRLTRVGPDDVVSHVASVSFDGATWELWSALLGGARLEVLDRDTVLDTRALAAAIEDRGITAMILTTSLFNHVARTVPAALGRLDTVIFGGETADASTVRDLLRAGGPRHLVHGYGPTENTTFSTVHEVTEVPDGATSVPIGGPVGNSRLYVLDAEQRHVPRGVPGELYVGGPGLARGYRGRPDLTAARFVPDPYAESGALMYSTGDLVRWLPDGSIDFIGRADQQIKLRGYRIEPGEIESALQTHPGLDHAAVVLREDNPGEKRLVAYVVAVPGTQSAPLPADLREHLTDALPDYMVPAAYVVLDRMPLTANGKLDTRALPVPGAEALAAARAGAAPATGDEIRIAAVWSEVLGVPDISVTDSFFDLGGDSIRAVTLVGALKKAGYEVTVTEVFEHRTIGKLAVAIAGREVQETRYVQPFELITPADRALVPAGVFDAYPLSQLQTGMLVELLAYDGPAANNYHNTTSFDIRDGIPFAPDAMREAARRVTARHEALRTSIDLDTYSVPMQLVHDGAEMPVSVHDLSGLDDEGWRERVLEISRGEQEHLFDMGKPPFVRLSFAVGDAGWRMFLSLNHTILEGWGHYSLWMELLTTYAALRDGREPTPAALPPLRFADFIAGEHESLASPEERAYWRGIVTDHAQFTLPAAWRRPEETGRAFSVTVSLRDLQPRIKAAAAAADVPVKSVLLATHLKVMSQLTEERDFYTGLVCDTRPELPGADLVYGMYLNTLPIHHKGGAGTWRELLTRVFAQETELWGNRRFPLPEVQREAGGRRIIDVFFNYLDFRQIDTELMDLGSSLREGGTEFDLAVTTMAGELGLLTDTRVMSREQAQRLGRMYRLVLEAIVEDLEGDATEVLLAEDERALLLGEWAGRAGTDHDTTPVHHRFAARAAEHPDAVAVVTAGEELSYGELDARANRFAHHLAARGVRRGDSVAILLERGPDMLVAVLGTLKAGAAYLPLDPETPVGRIAHQLADSQAPVLVTQDALLSAVPAGHAARQLVLEREAAAIAARPAGDPGVAVDGDDLVYTIYTSGSTGLPKGVLVTHGGLANYLDWALEHYGMDGANGAPMFGSIAFDLAVPSFLLPLISGRDVTMVPGDRGQEALPDLLRAGGDYSILKITPAHLDLVCAALGEGTALDSVRTFVVGGEEMKPEMVAAWRRTAPGARVINEYGPTETVVGCVVHDATATGTTADGVPVPIGRPITNTEVYVLDAAMRPVPAGTVGELYLGGAGVARGYGGRPALTAEKFGPHPFTDRAGARLYRTGDLARFRPDGSLDFLGRGDDQVKIRGYRVELGEIEATLLLAPGVRDAVVLARQDRPGERRLVAYVVPAEGASPDPAALAAELRRTLPAYMVPAVFVTLDALPLSVSGKVDRKALPAPGHDRTADTGRPPYAAPATATEELLARIWGEALGLAKIGAHDSFFDLGGDSIMVLPLISAARKAGLTISLRTLYENETLAELAAAVAPRAAAPSRTAPALASPAEAMIEHQVPGVSVAVVRDGALAEVRGFGVTSAGGGAKVTPDTLFPAASMSKFVSALGVLRLAKDGLIDLDADVNGHLTSWQVPGTREVTTDRLLRFTSGVTHPETALETPFYGRTDPRPTAAEILHGRAPAKTPPVVVEGVPGQVFMKNNVGYTVLQQLIEDVTGTPFPQYMREKVFAPLGMTASHYEPELPAGAPAATGHDESGAPLPEGAKAHPDTAAAGLWTTAADLARVLLEIRRAHRGEPSEVLDAALADRMLTVVEPGRFYGMGSIVDTTGGDLEYGHTGRTSGFHALALGNLGSGTGVVVLTNADSGRAVLKQVLASVRDADEAWAGQGEMTRLWEQGRINPDAQD
nr:non-ribosomal peptide synthetase 5 [Streptomyces sp.]